MFHKDFFNLKNTLITIQVLFFLLFLVFFSINSIKEAQKILDRQKTSYLNQVKLIARSENKIDAIYGILKTLSINPSLKKLDKGEILEQFQTLVRTTGLFHNLLLADPEGNLLLSTIPAGKITPASDRLYFKRAKEKKDFVWGEFAISRSTKKPVIHFAMPVLNEKNEIVSIIVAVPVMENLLPSFENLNHDYFLLDENGVIVRAKDNKIIGQRYDHYTKIYETMKSDDVILYRDHFIAFSKTIINGNVFSTFVMEVPSSINLILKEANFFHQLFFSLIAFFILIILTSVVAKKIILNPLSDIEKHLKSFLDGKGLSKIEKSYTGELELFKKVYNKFIESIEEKNEEINKERDFWLNIFNDIPDPIFIVDKNFKIIVANETFLNTFRLTLEDIKGKHCYEICHESPSPADICPHKIVIEKHISINSEVFFPQLKKWFLITFTNFDISGNESATIHIFKDITDIKKAEEERLRIEKQFLHTQKLESLGILAGGIAHDFNNLLMGILGNAELALMNRESLPVPVINNIETIKKITEKAAHLTRQMLAYSGKGKFVIKEIEINSFIKEIFDLIKVSISKKAVISLNLNEKEPLVINGDPGQIEQVILNLVINASEALEEKDGLITITTGKQYCDSKYFENTVDGGIRQFKEGEYVYFEITDTGCGMDKETMNKIFEPFFTTKFTGRGLGLSAILGIVRGHGGAIRVYSEKGKGTSFKILFPAVTPLAKKDDDKEIFSNLAGKTFLIIDDEEVVREVTKKMVELLGGKAITAKDGIEGIEIFKNNSDKIDSVLLDLTMPILSGEEVFRELKKIKGDLTVILMSGYNDQDVSQRLVGKGFAGFIQKPFTVQKLLEVLKIENV